jgi:hypothetical protein
MTTPSNPSGDDETTVSLKSRRLSAKEARLVRALSAHSPLLADLYRQTLILSDSTDRPAFVGVAAHSARELNNGLLQKLQGYQQLTREERAEAEAKGEAPEAQADAMGRALELRPDHPSVRFWFALQQALVDAAHFRGMEPNRKEALQAIRDLTPLLDTLVGPHFDVQAELEAVVTKETPSEGDIGAVLIAFGNPRLRRYCFERFRGAGWLKALKAKKGLDVPPMARRYDDGSWSPAPWPAGDYVLRCAAEAPDLVRTVLESIPKSNDNPAVWDIAAKCALQLPVAENGKLHGLIAHGVTKVPHVIWPRTLVELVERLAIGGAIESALQIAKNLCVLRDAAANTKAPVFDQPPFFARLAQHDSDELVPRLARAITSADPAAAQEWLARALGGAAKRTHRGRGFSLDEMDPSPQQGPITRARDALKRKLKGIRRRDDDPAYWCDRLDEDDDHETDVRVILARALAAASVARATVSESEATTALARLGAERHKVFQRIRQFTLARCSPFAVEALNQWLESDDALLQEFRNRESGDVLRLRFSEASPTARRAFVTRAARGPRRSWRERLAVWLSRGVEQTEDSRKRWQLRILRRFDAALPEDLLPLAETLGYKAQERTAEQEGMDEDGFFSGGAHWIGERSPSTPAELEEKSDEEIVQQLLTWTPLESQSDGPSIAGLVQAVSEFVAANLARGIEIGFAIDSSSQNAARAVTAIARGLRSIPTDKRTSIPPRLFEWFGTAPERIGGKRGVETDSAEEWRGEQEACRECLDGLKSWVPAAANADQLGAAWNAVDTWLANPLLWRPSTTGSSETTDALLMGALNSLEGIMAEVVVVATQRTYRLASGVDTPQSAEAIAAGKAAVNTTASPRLKTLMARGSQNVSTLAVLGQHMPFLHYTAADWVSEAREQLLEQKMAALPISAFWAAYLLTGRLYESTFKAWREQYRATATLLDLYPGAGQWSIPQHLAEHIITTVVWGLVAPGDDDALLETTWEKLGEDELSHAYWSLFRGWSDAAEAIPADMIRRLEMFWEWRLEEIEKEGRANAARIAEANALSWFCITPHVPLAVIYRLGVRTLNHADAKNSATMSLWELLANAPDSDADSMWPLVNSAIQAELRGPYPRLFVNELGPILAKIARLGTKETRTQVRDLFHDLGRRGFEEFRSYLPDPTGENDTQPG